jgi:hypothetical protein
MTPPEGKPPWTAEDNDAGFIVKDRNRRAGVLPLRAPRCSSKRRRFASNRRSVFSASNVSTPAALKRTMRPFCCCTMRRPSATSSSARRRSFAESIYRNDAQQQRKCRPDSAPGGVGFAPGHCELANPALLIVRFEKGFAIIDRAQVRCMGPGHRRIFQASRLGLAPFAQAFGDDLDRG